MRFYIMKKILAVTGVVIVCFVSLFVPSFAATYNFKMSEPLVMSYDNGVTYCFNFYTVLTFSDKEPLIVVSDVLSSSNLTLESSTGTVVGITAVSTDPNLLVRNYVYDLDGHLIYSKTMTSFKKSSGSLFYYYASVIPGDYSDFSSSDFHIPNGVSLDSSLTDTSISVSFLSSDGPLNTVFNFFSSLIRHVVTTVTSSPVLLVGLGIFVVGAIIGLSYRLIRG